MKNSLALSRLVGISIYWRLVLGFLAIIVVVAGVSIYAVTQLAQLSSLSTELVSVHYPAIETSKRLIGNLSNQLRSEKKFLIVRDTALMREFDQEADEFKRILTRLQAEEGTEQGRKLLQRAEQGYVQYRELIHELVETGLTKTQRGVGDYERRRDAQFGKITDALQTYNGLHEVRVNAIISETSMRTVQAEAVMKELLLVSILIAIVLAAVFSYSILRPLRRVQEHMRTIGQGKFGESMEVAAPQELRELLETVNWMDKKLKELDEAKAEFFAHISHELRSPLASIKEGMQLMLDQVPGPLSQPQRETLQIMKDSSERLIRLISNLLDLSKMEAGMMAYQFVPTDLKRLADGSVNKMRLLAESKHIPIFIIASEGRLWLSIDAARIEQVIDNLLANALKFSPDRATINIHIQPDPAARGIRISVADNGPGIPADELPHVFERFYQGRRRTTQKVGGSGLGLALVKQIVEGHKGKIWVESEMGKGTTVHFVLPVMERGIAA